MQKGDVSPSTEVSGVGGLLRGAPRREMRAAERRVGERGRKWRGLQAVPYLILFGNSWNQCWADAAVIHLEGWVVPKEHSPLFLFTCRGPPLFKFPIPTPSHSHSAGE